jgi:hypothetical protein
MAGPISVAHPQNVSPYGILGKERISAAEAPPVARTGPPRKPCRKRRTTRPGKLETREVTAVIIMKREKETK